MQIKNRQQLLSILAIGSLVLLGGDRLIVSPLISSWNARSKSIVELKTQLDQHAQLISRDAIIRSRLEHMRTNTFQGDTSSADDQMFKAFDRWSTASKITISSIKPQWKQSEDDYTTLECRADASGDMEKIAQFLHEIEKDPLAIKIEAIEITSHDNDGQQLSLGLQVSGLLLLPKEQ